MTTPYDNLGAAVARLITDLDQAKRERDSCRHALQQIYMLPVPTDGLRHHIGELHAIAGSALAEFSPSIAEAIDRAMAKAEKGE